MIYSTRTPRFNSAALPRKVRFDRSRRGLDINFCSQTPSAGLSVPSHCRGNAGLIFRGHRAMFVA